MPVDRKAHSATERQAWPHDQAPRGRTVGAKALFLGVGAVAAIAVGLVSAFSTTEPQPMVSTAQPVQGAPAGPNATAAIVATYGDWVIRCQAVGADRRSCETSQTIVRKDQQTPIAQIALARTGRGEMRAVVLLPVNVSLQSGVRVTGLGNQPNQLAWRRCLPGVCVADAALPVSSLASAGGVGRLVYQQSGGQNVDLPISLNGFSSSLQALPGGAGESLELK